MKRTQLKAIRLLYFCFLFGAGVLNAELSETKIRIITEHLQELRHDWTVKDTREMLKDADGGAMEFTSIVGDDGKKVHISISGDTVLVEGKDISGNLGSKSTFGANSPIIEDVHDSQIATGDKSSVTNQRSTSYTISISLSVALSLSIALNAYLLRRAKNRTGSGRTKSAKETL